MSLSQEDINILAAEFNCTDIEADEMFAKALTLCQKWKKELQAERKKLSLAKEALEKYGEHFGECRLNNPATDWRYSGERYPRPECNCGFKEALSEMNLTKEFGSNNGEDELGYLKEEK